MIKLGIIGAGDVVRVRHIPILREFFRDSVRVGAVATRRPHAAEEIDDLLGYRATRVDDYRDLLELELDAVLVAVPTSVTEEIVSETLALGVATYSEKPMGQTFIGANRLQLLAKRMAVPYLVGENFWYQERFAAAEGLLEVHEQNLLSLRIIDRLRREGRENPRSDIALIWEHAPHALNAARRLMGHHIGDRQVQATITGNGDQTRLDLLLKSSSGTETDLAIIIQEEWSRDDYMGTAVDGTELRITHRFDFKEEKYTDTLSYRDVALEFRLAECGIRGCWADFLRAIAGDMAGALATQRRALEQTQIIEAARLSCEKDGTPVPVLSDTWGS